MYAFEILNYIRFYKFETFKVAAYYNVDTLFVLGTFGNKEYAAIPTAKHSAHYVTSSRPMSYYICI